MSASPLQREWTSPFLDPGKSQYRDVSSAVRAPAISPMTVTPLCPRQQCPWVTWVLALTLAVIWKQISAGLARLSSCWSLAWNASLLDHQLTFEHAALLKGFSHQPCLTSPGYLPCVWQCSECWKLVDSLSCCPMLWHVWRSRSPEQEGARPGPCGFWSGVRMDAGALVQDARSSPPRPAELTPGTVAGAVGPCGSPPHSRPPSSACVSSFALSTFWGTVYLSGLSSLVSVPPLGRGRQACFLALFPPSVITVVPDTYQVLSKYLGDGWMDRWMDGWMMVVLVPSWISIVNLMLPTPLHFVSSKVCERIIYIWFKCISPVHQLFVLTSFSSMCELVQWWYIFCSHGDIFEDVFWMVCYAAS